MLPGSGALAIAPDQPPQNLTRNTNPCRSERARENPKTSTYPAKYPGHRNQAHSHKLHAYFYSWKLSLRIIHHCLNHDRNE